MSKNHKNTEYRCKYSEVSNILRFKQVLRNFNLLTGFAESLSISIFQSE